MPPIADMRYRVQRKEITGKPATEGGLFHTVAYCLQPRGVDWCWWILCNYDADTPFKDVQRAQPAAQTSEASPQQSTPAAGDAQPATPPQLRRFRR